MRNFKHLTAYQRGEIQALLKEGLPKIRIAQKVGIARSTLYEELKRGTVEQMNSISPNAVNISLTRGNASMRNIAKSAVSLIRWMLHLTSCDI